MARWVSSPTRGSIRMHRSRTSPRLMRIRSIRRHFLILKEPYVPSIPDEHGRYYMMPMLNGWTTVSRVRGTRTTGTKAQKYLISGPG